MRNRIFITIILIISLIPVKAEPPLKNRNSGSSKDNRFMVGVKGGVTFVQPIVMQKFNVLSPLDGAIAQSGMKTYKPFYQNIGYQYAFTALYQLKSSLDLRIEPTFSTYRYKYRTAFSWVSSGGNTERIDMLLKHRQSLNYLEIPVTLRYLFGSGNARPFVQGGIYYGFLMNANKTAEKTETYSNTSGTSTLNTEKLSGDAMLLYIKSRYGFNAGMGIDYDLSVVHLTFDINLNFGINSVVSEAGRYANQQYISGLYDIQDNIRFLIPSVNVGLLFPLRKASRSKLVCKTPLS